MNELKFTGGARIGLANITIPFAKLRIKKSQLELNASIIGNLIFQPHDIISIEPYTSIPFLGQGIKINHTVDPYKENVIFWTLDDSKSVIKQIKETGFLDHDNLQNRSIDHSILEKQKRGGFPIKIPVAIATVIIWNVLFLYDIISFFQNGMETLPTGNGVLSALGFIFFFTFATLVSGNFRKLILKEGRELNDIKTFAYFLLFLTGVMFIGFWITLKVFLKGAL